MNWRYKITYQNNDASSKGISSSAWFDDLPKLMLIIHWDVASIMDRDMIILSVGIEHD